LLRTVLALLLASVFIGCQQRSPAPLRVATNVWPGYEPLYAARELGMLDTRAVHLVEASSASEVIRLFRNGAVDAGALTLDEVMRLSADGIDCVVILVTDTSNGADAIIARSELSTMQSLEGRRLGVESGAVGAFVAARAFALHGIDSSKVELVPLEIHELARAFVEERVDAVVTFDPVRATLLTQGAHSLFDSSQIPGEVVDVIVVRRSFLLETPAPVYELVSTWFEAVERLHDRPHELVPLMAARERISEAAMREALASIDIPDHAQNLELMVSPDGLRMSGKRLSQEMVRQQLLAAPADMNALLAPGPLQANGL